MVTFQIPKVNRGRIKKTIRALVGTRSLLYAFVTIFAFIHAFFMGNVPNSPAQKRPSGPPRAVVEVSTVVEKDVVNYVSLVGTGQAWLETIVASEEAGVVSEMLVEEGEQVTKNQELCVQDTSQLQLQIEAARAELAEAKILEAQALRNWERQKKLFDINSVSEKAYDDANFSLNAAKKKTARLQAALSSLEDQLRKSTIKAPVSGYVVERHCLVGQWLGKGNPAVTLVVPDPILFMVSLPERYVPTINKGDLAEVTFDALPGRTFEGKIDAIIPRADEAARTFPVRIKISNSDGAIKPGMLGRATLPAGGLHKAILVPKDALVLSGSRKALFLIIDGTARLVPVKTEAAYGPLIEVKGELKPGQQVVIRGNERLRPGQAVKILPSTPTKMAPD